MLEWVELTPVLAAMVVVSVVPGYFWVRSWVRSSVVAVAVAPALTVGIVTVLSILWHRLGIFWSAATVMPVFGVVAVLGLVVFLLRRRKRPDVAEMLGDRFEVRPPLSADAPSSHAYRLLSRRSRVAIWCMVVVGWLVAALPLLIAADPADPVQQWDPVFHLNGVWNILQTGQAQPTGGLSALYDGRVVSYPTAWHAFTALFAAPTGVVQVANMTSILLMGIWVVGGTALTAVVSTSRAAVAAAPVIAGCTLDMPADALTMYNQWPNAMGVAMLPGVVALAIVLGRRLERSTEVGAHGVLAQIPLLLVLVSASMGLVGAHPSSVFGLVAILVAPLLGSLWRMARRSVWLRDRVGVVLQCLLAVAVVVVPLGVLTTKKLRAMGGYPRHGTSVAEAFAHFLTPYPPFSSTLGMGLTVAILAVLMLIGVISAVSGARKWDAQVARTCSQPWSDPEAASAQAGETRAELTHAWAGRRERIRSAYGPRPLVWPIASFLVLAALTFLAYAPDSALRTFLLAPWYLDPRRITAVQDVMIIPIAAVGFEAAVNWIRSHRVHRAEEHRSSGGQWRIGVLLGAWLLALSLCGALDARLVAVRYVYDANHLGKPGMATEAELAMLRRMPETLPADALVLGDPIAGAAYTEVIGQREAVYPQLYHSVQNSHDQDILINHFNEIQTNPEVCEVILRRGITYFYQDADGWYYQSLRSSRAPGLYNVDTSSGFELVDEGGTARLYRITACG